MSSCKVTDGVAIFAGANQDLRWLYLHHNAAVVIICFNVEEPEVFSIIVTCYLFNNTPLLARFVYFAATIVFAS